MDTNKAENISEVALNNPEKYWAEVANLGFWFKAWTQTLDSSNKPLYRWFVGGETNICYNFLDGNVANGNGDKIAVICESSATRTNSVITYNDLLDQVSRFAAVLQKLGVVKGDVVFSYMPNILELIVAILATWRIGGVVLTFLPNTTANSLADRIELAKPTIFITSNATKLNNDIVLFKKPLDEAIQKLNYQAKVVVFQRNEFDPAEINPDTDVLWDDLMQSAELTNCVPVESNQASMICCSSGTTGKPKGIALSTGGFLSQMWNKIKMGKTHFMRDAKVTLSPSHPGWLSGIMGIFSPMIVGCCGVVYDGDAAGNGDVDTLYRIIRDRKVQFVVLNAATLRDLRLKDPQGVHAKKYDLSSVTSLTSAGEYVDEINRDWANKIFPVKLLEMWGQTEGPHALEPTKPIENKEVISADGLPKYPGIGYTFKIFDEEGKEQPTGETGFIAAKFPLPPAGISTLYQDDELYIKEYCSSYPGYFNTKDLGWMDKNGGLHIVGRGDDVMKVSGVTMSTLETENTILKNPDIAECAVVVLKHVEMYQVPVAFYILKKGVENNEFAIMEKMKDHMKQSFGPTVIFKFALHVNNIPKTLTGKIIRKVIQTELEKSIKQIAHADDPDKIFHKMRQAAVNIAML